MSQAKRSSVSGVDTPLEAEADEQPPSGVILRRETLAGKPRLAVSMNALMTMHLDHRAGFILSFADGNHSIDMLLDACAMSREEALAILYDLEGKGIIEIV
jgi:hypothetical protein